MSSEEDEVFCILSTLDGSKAVGIDGISPLLVDTGKHRWTRVNSGKSR